MGLSTGVILSILSANVFAIEHPNGVHPGSLLVRRAVVADADGVFLQKRNNDKEQKDQKKRDKSNKYSTLDSQQDKYVHRKGGFGEDLYPGPNPNDDTKESNTDSHTYLFDQNRGATGGREDVHTDVDLDQERSSFADASRGSFSRVLGHIRKGLYRTKHEVKLFFITEMAFATYKKVWHHFGDPDGYTIGWDVFKMLEYALYRSNSYKRLYKTPFESPFIIKLPSSASDEQRETYKILQDEVHKSIKNHISAIMHALNFIFTRPESVLLELESMLSSADRFYLSISNIRSEYSRLLEELGMSGSGHLANLDAHMTILRAYKCNLSERLNIIKGFIENTIKPPNQEGSSKFSSSTLGSNRLSEIGSKPSEDVASSSIQLEDVASSSTQSNVAVVNNLVILANQ
ncbi:hypothetical protein BASA50_000543 [Batrachochytrium salamandrivorans]|uniref:Uncharacterized protein n=1 Tax=Batrachochytrium salamandrivorans TaxID=1357716 RepID=A0ABQ8ETJ4_9FUNG|nr:hypothetical protein BASA50_000543 [Batrachochytrium salamandrivorans]KAH9250168.1 hypothetical protein BASA81_012046 [Batrachochytrium salamandrivorans]KAH9268042.1 hypothetical protein BASA83_009547 [Batrachochytrium salamandrivorans]